MLSSWKGLFIYLFIISSFLLIKLNGINTYRETEPNWTQNQPPTPFPTMKPSSLPLLLLLATPLILTIPTPVHSSGHDYGDALSKSILFFEGQRSGYLPQDQRLTWRANSGLSDGWMYNTDLVGGYYDAGDNVKFGFPMAFTTSLLAWSVVEFGELMPGNERRNALVAIRWATDYLLKTVSQPNRIFVQVRGKKVIIII